MVNYSREKLIKAARMLKVIKTSGVIILLVFIIVSILNSR